ncbi:S8 family serine peptidase [Nocardioides scoriae]|uniref:S8 family serine peptidase n=1 Tax=Nocardioides scoriae TaxID=642780 RepID=UPI0038B3ECA2
MASLASTGLALTSTAATAAPDPRPDARPDARAASGAGLDKQDRALLGEARANGEKRVTLLVAATEGDSAAVADRLQAVGGRVEKEQAELGYLRVSVPTGEAKRAAKVTGVQAVDLDQVIPLEDPRPEGSQPPTAYTPPGRSTPKVNPYMPIGETQAAQLTAGNKKWDGRDVTIGIVDSGIDLDHPALQQTTTGERKVTEWRTFTDPVDDDDPTWLDMTDSVSGTSFVFDGTTYTAPKNRSYRIDVFDERDPRLGGEVGNDVDRDGNPAGSDGKFPVLWDTRADEVYVDTDQDDDFSDEQAMSDYSDDYDIGHFGQDRPGTAVKETMPFVVQTDKKSGFVNIGIVSGAHGSHVAGITAANQMFGGAMSGAAPGATLKSARVCLFVDGCTAHALIEGMSWLAKEGKADVINMSIGGLPALNDGNNARAVLYDRLVDTYKVQIFISAGNSGSGMNTVGDPSVATKVVSVGSSISDDTWRSNYGSDSEYADNLHGFSSRGPREDGGFKPQVVAPGSAVSTVPQWQNPTGACLPYACPPGYAMFNGTSMASPQAAGSAALLVSAAKQSGAQYKPAQIREAMTSTARFFDRYGAYEQGNGLIDTVKAWKLLKQNLKTVEITSSVPVSTALSAFLATPGKGTGIYDREGVEAGDSYTRSYTFTRFSGRSGTVTYDLGWVGNDGTFTAPRSVSLPLGTPVTVPVRVNPKSSGAHSAVLNLDDARTPGIEYQTLNTVVAAERFTAAGNYTYKTQGEIGRNQTRSYFFDVPKGTPAFKVDLQGGGATPGAGQIRFLRFHPYGVGVDTNSTTYCYNPDAGAGCPGGGPSSRTVSDPQAGVWEVTVEARRTSDAVRAPYTLTASVLGAEVSPNPDVIESAAAGTPLQRTYTIENLFGDVTARAVGTTFGSAKRGTETIASGEQKVFPVQVTAGATSLRATIGSTSDTAADLDLTVLDCTTGTCVVAGTSADGDSEESVTIANPKAGTYRVVVDGYSVPSGSTQYSYTDVFTNPAFGSVAVQDANALRPAGSTWTVPATVTALAAPGAGRELLGAVQVRTDAGVLIGSGDVVVEEVTGAP